MRRFTPTPISSSRQGSSYFTQSRSHFFTFDAAPGKRQELPPIVLPLKAVAYKSISEKHLGRKDSMPMSLPSRYMNFSTMQSPKPFDGEQLKESARCSLKHNGIVEGYAVNTSEGLVRTYNEDRVSIVYNIVKPPTRGEIAWPVCSYFGVFDGHGGAGCADFLKDSLHHYVVKQSCFPAKPKKALIKGFKAAEAAWTCQALADVNSIDKSGSCAVVMLIVGDFCYVANLGDSRAVLSAEAGAKVYSLTKDHKPSEESEKARILAAGGEVYQTLINTGSSIIPGVHRINPGRLSVSRSFGDVEAKQEQFGGNQGVLITVPDIKTFRVVEGFDFVLLACDGIFDKLSNKEAIAAVWSSLNSRALTIHRQCGVGVDSVMQTALNRRTVDNVTALLVAFSNFKKTFQSDVHN